MQFLELKNNLGHAIVFSTRDIEKSFGSYDPRRLVEWQHKGYIKRLRNTYYCFPEAKADELFLYLVANRIYRPSYISLESALALYGLIPEGVYCITSVSSAKTNSFFNDFGQFTYNHLKPSLFFGYDVRHYQSLPVKVASLEKAILDYLYLRHNVDTQEDVVGLRWNKEVLHTLDPKKMDDYASLFSSKKLYQRIKILRDYYA